MILFARNVADPDQLRALTASLPPGAAVLVDQEGGRVARLRPPPWRAHPPAARIGTLPAERARRAAFLQGALIGAECRAAGIGTVCAPVLDRRIPGASDAIGDRAFSDDPAVVAALAAAMAEGLLAAGAIPVGKHAPGHGRALVDSHRALPLVPAAADLAPDIAPFAACAWLPWMMTAHVLYAGLDPDRPGTVSPIVIEHTIRRRIGFEGVLVSDDLAMGALHGSPAERAQAALAAGCDLALHCSGILADTEAVLRVAPPLTPAASARLEAAHTLAAARAQPLDLPALAAERDALLA